MAEVIAAIGLTASVISIVDFTQKFSRRLKEYGEESSRLPLAFQAIQIELPLILKCLETVEVHAKSDQKLSEFAPLTEPIIKACHGEMDKLEKLFSYLSLSPNASRFKKKTQALKTLHYDSDIQNSMTTLKNYIQTLILLLQINPISSQPSRLLLQDTLQDSHDPEAPETPTEEVICEDESGESMLGLQRRTNNIDVWQKYLDPKRCICQKHHLFVREVSRWNLLSTKFSMQSLSRHKPGCPFFSQNDKLRKLTLDLEYMSHILGKRLKLAFSMQFRPEGMYIDPKLEFRGVRRTGSPAFALVKHYAHFYDERNQMSVDQFQLQMRQLFESGKASPSDMDEEGNTLITVRLVSLVIVSSCLTLI